MWHTRLTAIVCRPEMCSVIPANVDGRSALREPLPSLSACFPLPEPHPDYHAVLASLHAKRIAQQASRRMNVSHCHFGGELESDAALSNHERRQTVSPISGNSPKTPSNQTPSSCDLIVQQNEKSAGTLPHLAFIPNGLPKTDNSQQMCIEAQQKDALNNLTLLKTTSRPPPPPSMTTPMQHPFGPPMHATATQLAKPASVAAPVPLPKRASSGLLSASSLAEMGLLRPATIHSTQEHKVTSGRYATAADQRGYIPVFEYSVNGSAILIDAENSYVLLTSICKAIGPFRSDIVRHVESVPELECLCRKIRGGFLKIQGTWVPYKLAYEICRRVAWQIRTDLVPIFGHDFPARCLAPLDSGYGDLRILTTSRRIRRSPVVATAVLPRARMEQSQSIVGTPNSQPNQTLTTPQRDASLAASVQQQHAVGQFPYTSQPMTVAEPATQQSKMCVAKGDPMNTLSTCARSYLSLQGYVGPGRVNMLPEGTGVGQQQPPATHQSLPAAPRPVLAMQNANQMQQEVQYQQTNTQLTPQPQMQHGQQRKHAHSPVRCAAQPAHALSHPRFHPYDVRSKLASLANRPHPSTWPDHPLTASFYSRVDERNAYSGPIRFNTTKRP